MPKVVRDALQDARRQDDLLARDRRKRPDRQLARRRSACRDMRRGLLMHGPPGVGKTLTAMYLAAQMPDRTVVLLTGFGLGAVTTSVDLATALAPAIVILEDVDLVAMERSMEPTNAILFELLNAMDGLDADHDVLFVLTTNAPERIEPALAARPGRIDQAVELPLPDADGRRRLLGDRRAPAHRAGRAARRQRGADADAARRQRLTRHLGQFDVHDLDRRRRRLLAELDLLRRHLDGTELDPAREGRADEVDDELEVLLFLEAEALHDALHAVVREQPRELLGDVLAYVAALGLLAVGRDLLVGWDRHVCRSIPGCCMGDIGKPQRETERPAPVRVPRPEPAPQPAPPPTEKPAPREPVPA
jgi:hypothetical protein